jgi:hypothetical protein
VAKRYDQMLPLMKEFRPRVIAEIGVHTALRGATLCKEALQYRKRVHYIGCDIFGLGDAEFQAAALNGKGLPSEAKARERLSSIPGLTFDLVVGDTRETLKGTTLPVDFAFIDGDHRLDAIRSDYEAVKSARCVVFDDYYEDGPDLDVYGANRLVDELRTAGKRVEILPVGDRCKHGGVSYLAVVRR